MSAPKKLKWTISKRQLYKRVQEETEEVLNVIRNPDDREPSPTFDIISKPSCSTEPFEENRPIESSIGLYDSQSFELDLEQSSVSSLSVHSLMHRSNKDTGSLSDEVQSSKIVGTPCPSFNYDTFKGDLQKWAVNENIHQASLSKLLKLLKTVPTLENLPADARTLLRTPRQVEIISMENGEYVYFGIEHQIKMCLEKLGHNIPKELKLLINVDGTPIARSSTSQFWPQLGYLSSLKETSVFPIGIFHGYEKPNDSNIFMKTLVDELKVLTNNGIVLQNSNIQIVQIGFVCDTPAKSYILKTKGHAGFYSCTRCEVKGETRNDRLCFLDINAKRRTHEDFCLKRNIEHHTGDTIITELPTVDMIKSFPLDYMHLICIGIVKKVIGYWLTGKNRQRLGRPIVKQISEDLVKLKHEIPSDFARKPRSLEEYPRWKATEFRQFLLYTGPVVLGKHLNKDAFNNFLTLHVAVRLLLDVFKCYEYREYCESLLQHFVKSYAKLYGNDKVSHNVHQVIHLPDDILTYGSLENCSAFPFESYMQVLKGFLRKSNQPLQQVAKRIKECDSVPLETETSKGPNYKYMHSDGPLLSGVGICQQYNLYLSETGLKIDIRKSSDNCCVLNDGTIVLVENILCFGEEEPPAIIGKIMRKIGNLYDKPCNSSILGIHKTKLLASRHKWPISAIVRKCIAFHKHGKENVVIPLLHSST